VRALSRSHDAAVVASPRGLAARQRLLDRPREALALRSLPLVRALRKALHHLGGEQLEALADVFVAVVARLGDEDHLIDPGLLVAVDQVRDLARGPDGSPQAPQPLLEQPNPERGGVGADDLA